MCLPSPGSTGSLHLRKAGQRGLAHPPHPKSSDLRPPSDDKNRLRWAEGCVTGRRQSARSAALRKSALVPCPTHKRTSADRCSHGPLLKLVDLAIREGLATRDRISQAIPRLDEHAARNQRSAPTYTTSVSLRRRIGLELNRALKQQRAGLQASKGSAVHPALHAHTAHGLPLKLAKCRQVSALAILNTDRHLYLVAPP